MGATAGGVEEVSAATPDEVLDAGAAGVAETLAAAVGAGALAADAVAFGGSVGAAATVDVCALPAPSCAGEA